MKTPCYTTKTGLKIGSAYIPPVRSMTYQECEWQAVLLNKPRRVLSLKASAFLGLTLAVALMWIFKE